MTKPKLLHPRKVRGGVKLSGEINGPVLWAAQRWLRLIELAADGQRLVEGLEYAKLGQTKRMEVSAGRIDASVQGRSDRPYPVSITLARIEEAAWHKVVEAMSEGSLYAAKLLAGELPSNIEDVFRPLNLKLFPAEVAELQVSCTCDEYKAAAGTAVETPPSGAVAPVAAAGAGSPLWCKHLCCAGYLFAQRLANEPFLMFSARGLEGAELLEQLRDRRISASTGPGGMTPVYMQRPAGVADATFKPLDETAAEFWDAGPGLEHLDLPLTPPPVSHPLLRRLGPSPFTGAAFPLVGLLASVYDVIGEAARKTAAAEEPRMDGEPRVDADEGGLEEEDAEGT